MSTAWLMIVSCVFLSGLASYAADLTLVADGKPNAVIVVAAAETNAVRAAAEIQKYIEKMSGAKLPIVTEGEPALAGAPVAILVGHTAAAKKLGVKIPAGFNPAIRPEAFEEEGYVLKTKGTSLVVAGNSDGPYQGTLYAAYALLEKLGCRWYFPGEWGEIVPQQKTVSVPELDVTSRPDFAVRGIYLLGWSSEENRRIYNEWSPKVGFARVGDMYPTAGDGYLAALLPPAEYAEAHPDYYAMDKQGQRTATPKSPTWSTMLCLSNPDVVTASVASLKAVFAGQKKMGGNVMANGVGISPPDGTPFCYCEKCLAGSQNFTYPTYFNERLQGEEICGFVTQLAKVFPDKFFALSGYSLREMPPQGMTLPPNFSVITWPISSCVLHDARDTNCWRRQESMKILAGWRKLTPHVVAAGYAPGLLSVYGAGFCTFLPERDMANFTVAAPIYKKMGIKGSCEQGCSAIMSTWLSYYIRAKLLWDVKTDVPALKKEFYSTFFGPEAGPHVQAWWDACEEALSKATNHAHEDWLVTQIYNVAFTKKIHEHVEAARKATMTDAQRARVEAFALIADYLESFAAMNDAEMNLKYSEASAVAQHMVGDLHKLDAIYGFFVLKRGPPNKIQEGRGKHLAELAARLDGTTGKLVAPLPLEMKFTRDRFNEGVLAEWYAPTFDDAVWGLKNTYYTWDQQDVPEDAKGHDYDGYGWYRAGFDVDKSFAGKPVRLYLEGAINEIWVWVNGQYAGHGPHMLWWAGARKLDLDVTPLVKPGQRNTIAIRIWNDAEIGGLYGRGFLYSPTATPAPVAAKK